MGQRKKNPEQYAEDLAAQGYRRTSCRFGLVSRIDRPHWFEYMNKLSFFGRLKSAEKDEWEDHYRRCFSKDKLELGMSLGLKVPPSNGAVTGYIE